MCIFRNNKEFTTKYVSVITWLYFLLFVLHKNPNYIIHIHLLIHKANQLIISLL